MTLDSRTWYGAACAALLCARALSSQEPLASPPRDSTGAPGEKRGAPTAAPAPASQQPSSGTPVSLSGVLFANYQYGGVKGSRSTNRFDLDRAYLTVRARAGERVGIRVTADVFQQRDSTRDEYYRGWTIRAKYAYAQYDFPRRDTAATTYAVRLGILNTVVIEFEEQLWLRGIAQVAIDQNGYFSSADAGAAALVTFPGGLGEAYATITNGSGYQSRETDRFKDYAARVSFYPLASSTGVLKGLSLSPWFSRGVRASDFARGQGTLDPVSEGRRRDRAGVLIALRDPRLAVATHFTWRFDETESADTTADVAPNVSQQTGRVTSAFAIVRPLAFVNQSGTSPISLIARADHIEPDVDAAPYIRNYIAGVSYDLNRRTSLALDYQNRVPERGSAAVDTKTWFLHLIANF